MLEVHDLRKQYKDLRALAGVSFRLERGEIVALVGESGSGKSTVARILAHLTEPTGGNIVLDGAAVTQATPAYRRRVQMIFQDPYASLNPAHTIAHHLERPLAIHGRGGSVTELLEAVGLPAAFATRRPHELSGGQRQRVAIARALAVDPDVIVADEPTSMLDVTLRVEILDLMARLRRERGLAMLLITHDLGSARYLADRVLVMYAGSIVEEAPADVLLAEPAHPYTRQLLAAVPDPERRFTERPPTRRAEGIGGVGCAFAARCAWATARCRTESPSPTALTELHQVRCHRAAEILEDTP
jgi:oligopeptide/dipeptide ABC transporter ATP-binding protein